MPPGSRLSLTRCSVSIASVAKSASASRITTPAPPSPASPPRRSRLYGPLLGLGALVVAVDQGTKHLALERLSGRPPYDLIEGILRFRLTYNSGGAFGLFQGFPWVFLIATLAIAIGILIGVRRVDDTRWSVPLGLVLGGGLGNAVDRVFRDTSGGVVDFIDLHVWPVFNVADVAIVFGALGILLIGWKSDDERGGDATAT